MEKRGIQMEHLLSRLGGLHKKLGAAAILLLDYDGTLVPIAERPEVAFLSPDMKVLLKSLTERFKVAIISGRSLTEVRKLVGLKSIYYAGNHGLEIEGPRVKLLRPEAKRARPIIAKICRRLRKRLENIGGAIVEDKGLTASVHYRLVAQKELRALKNIFEEIVKPHLNAGEVRITEGKKVLEIRPSIRWGKGEAVIWIIDVIDPKKRLMPVYLGDDETDEDAFLALEKRGITVLVSEKRKKSQAKFFLRNVNEVKIFLKKLTEIK